MSIPESKPVNRLAPGLLLGGLVAGLVVGSTAPPAAAAVSSPREVSGATETRNTSDWRSRLVVERDAKSVTAKAYAAVSCSRWAPWGSINYLFILQANHTMDYAKGRGGGTCSTNVKGIGTELAAAKNGTHITQLDSNAFDDHTSGTYSDLALYQCGDCRGSWIAKHTVDYKKYSGQTMSLPDPPMDCNPLKDANNQVIGWSCFLADSYRVS